MPSPGARTVRETTHRNRASAFALVSPYVRIRHEGACIMRARARAKSSRRWRIAEAGRHEWLPNGCKGERSFFPPLSKRTTGSNMYHVLSLCHGPWRLNTNAVVFCSRLLYTRSGRSARRTSWRRWPKTGATHPCRERWRFRLTLWTVRIIRPYGTT